MQVAVDSDVKKKPNGARKQPPSVGQQFEMLTVVSAPWFDGGRTWVSCRCECGNTKSVRSNGLYTGNTKSCGCLQKMKVTAKNYKHGSSVDGARTPEYRTWAQMRARCTNKKLRSYVDYGGRGITVCDKWGKSFVAFLEDMGIKPGPEYSIERIDVNGNYEPSNCKWATDSEQANNTRRNRRMTHDGKTMTLTEWAAYLGVTPSTLHGRLRRNEMSVALAMQRNAKNVNK